MRLLLPLIFLCAQLAAQPVRLNPANPHYFEYKGRPLALVSSGEHYGAVVNTDFDFRKYLAALERDGLNLTRLFTGSYTEIPSSFGIKRNTLAPQEEVRLLPWKRVDGKWDLNAWEPRYDERLKAFMSEAARRGVIVELTLFSSHYAEEHWKHSPFHPANNSSGTTALDYKNLHTLNNGGILRYQEALVRKLVRDLNDFDNLMFEIQNEPWADQTVVADRINTFLPMPARDRWPNTSDVASEASLAWQAKVAEWIRDEESRLPKRHLITQNVCNFRLPLRGVLPGVSVVNFHYASPEAAIWNQGLNIVVGDNETGFMGREDKVYRQEAWRFMMAGGGLFNHLDYSFTTGKEDGSDTEPNGPGGGSPALRGQLGILSGFLQSLPLTAMAPDAAVVKWAPGMKTQALSTPGRVYAIYLTGDGPVELKLALPAGSWSAEWMDPKTGTVLQRAEFKTGSGPSTLLGPPIVEDLTLKITARR